MMIGITRTYTWSCILISVFEEKKRYFTEFNYFFVIVLKIIVILIKQDYDKRTKKSRGLGINI